VDTSILNLRSIFQKEVQYLIPLFQRPYVWVEDLQWAPLWDDVARAAEIYREQQRRSNDSATALKETGRHFMGAIVLQQQSTGVDEPERRHVVDGQQRLTTLQLLLDAAREVFENRGYAKEGLQLGKLVLNDKELYPAEEHRLKVCPTLTDQEAFRRAMYDDLPADSPTEPLIVRAHAFFKTRVEESLGTAPDEARARASAITAVLLAVLEVVVIELQPGDDENMIFETLNARGTPLLDSDLIKNWIMHRAGEEGHDGDALYHQHWQGFDTNWWRMEVRQGRLSRPRIDIYLHYWLTMQKRAEVPANRFFKAFQTYAVSLPGGVESVVSEIDRSSAAFRRIHSTAQDATLTKFLYRWRILDAGVTTPLLLWLLTEREEIGESAFLATLTAIESYFVRRMICRFTAKDYNNLVLDLLRKLHAAPRECAANVVTEHLSDQTAVTRVWPTDADVRENLLTQPAYQTFTRPRLRMLLEAAEDDMRSKMSEEQLAAWGTLTIEHIMPRAWARHWSADLDVHPPELRAGIEESRDRIVHTIGNLTLVNGHLNPSLSNGAWTDKRAELRRHSVLRLNSDLLMSAGDVWNEGAIRARGAALAERILAVWPRPHRARPDVHIEE
jgi:hypothetical protein